MTERTITVELTPDEIDAVCTAAESNFVSTGPLPAEESGVTKLRAALSSDHQGGRRFTAEEVLEPIAGAILDPGKYTERRLVPDPPSDFLQPEHLNSWQMRAIRVVLGAEAADQPPAPRGLSEEPIQRLKAEADRLWEKATVLYEARNPKANDVQSRCNSLREAIEFLTGSRPPRPDQDGGS